jgi:hypothetical protein
MAHPVSGSHKESLLGFPPDAAGICVQACSVGGGYYDFLDLGQGRLAFVLADIAGKGIAAALLMANLQANMRSQMVSAIDQPNLEGTVLMDGFVGARWKIAQQRGRAVLTVEPFAPLRNRDRTAISEEGAGLLSFALPTAETKEILFANY